MITQIENKIQRLIKLCRFGPLIHSAKIANILGRDRMKVNEKILVVITEELAERRNTVDKMTNYFLTKAFIRPTHYGRIDLRELRRKGLDFVRSDESCFLILDYTKEKETDKVSVSQFVGYFDIVLIMDKGSNGESRFTPIRLI